MKAAPDVLLALPKEILAADLRLNVIPAETGLSCHQAWAGVPPFE